DGTRPRKSALGKTALGTAESRQHDEVVAVNDLVRDALGEITRAPARDRAQGVPGHPREALRERAPVFADDLDGVVGFEPTVDVAHTGREQRTAVAGQRPASAVVDDHAAGGA